MSAMLPWTSRLWSTPLAEPEYRSEVSERIAQSVSVTDSGCWEWIKYRTSDGYGCVSIKRRMVRVHQVTLAITRGGMWPDHLQVDHLCRNRACCNPQHLEIVTAQENVMRGVAPTITSLRGRSKTHCPKGHPYDEHNTYRRPSDGSRRCKRCRADGMRGKPQWRNRNNKKGEAA